MEFPLVKMPVGDYLPDGTFDGEEIELEGREVSVCDGLWTTAGPGYLYGFIYRLYECPGGYRVHEFLWPLVPGRSAQASLYPEAGDQVYGTYTEQEAREHYGHRFRDHFEPG